MFAKPQTVAVNVGGNNYTLKPMTGERWTTWIKDTMEDGRLAVSAGRENYTAELMRALFLRGYERASQALGCTVLEAAELTEDERREVIRVQDALNRMDVIEPCFARAIEQGAARAYLDMEAKDG